jgi:hypothetical protein
MVGVMLCGTRVLLCGAGEMLHNLPMFCYVIAWCYAAGLILCSWWGVVGVVLCGNLVSVVLCGADGAFILYWFKRSNC